MIDWFNRDVSLPALVDAINQKFITFLGMISNTFTEVNGNIKGLDDRVTALEGSDSGGGGSSFEPTSIAFNDDGSILEMDSSSTTRTTTFPSDDSVVETYADSSGAVTKTVTTTFNSDGSITITTT